MWSFLSNLPTGWAIFIIILLIIALVIISLRGKIRAKFGNKEIDIGGDTNSRSVPSPSSTHPIRTCGDCVLILMGEREKSELQIRKEHDRILKTQMVYAEQKLIEIQTTLIDNLVHTIHKSNTSVDDAIQHKLVYGLFRDAMLGIKDEIRRSFKDNGFYDFSSSEFSEFVKDRVNVISSMLNQHIRNIYPDKEGILGINEIINIMEEQDQFISSIITDVYYHSKEVKIEAENKINRITKTFGEWVDKFIK